MAVAIPSSQTLENDAAVAHQSLEHIQLFHGGDESVAQLKSDQSDINDFYPVV